MGKRRLSREVALQALYLADVSTIKAEEALEGVLAGIPDFDEESREFSQNLLRGAVSRQAEIDDAIRATADNWSLERMTTVDRNILRLASFELLNHPETPVGVVIDEALEIAKKFSTSKASRFINGILDKIKSRRPQADEKT